MTPLVWFFNILAIAAFAVEAWALVDAIRRPPGAFTASGKQTKQIWLLILGVAAVIGLYGAAVGTNYTSFLPFVAFAAAAIYLVDVRPKVSEYKNGGSSSGPYGPW